MKADLPKERWAVQSSATALKSGLDLPVIDSIISKLAPICFAFPPFLPLKPTTQNRDFVLIQIGKGPDAKTIASGSDDQTVKLWEASSGKLLSTLEGHTGYVYSVAWSPDGKTVASGSDDKTVKLWEASLSFSINSLTGHRLSLLGVYDLIEKHFFS